MTDTTQTPLTPVQGNQYEYVIAKDALAQYMVSLTPMQRLYVEARLSGNAPLPAARIAGFSTPEVNAYRVEKHPGVRAAIEAGARMMQEKFAVNREDVIRGLLDAVHCAGSATELTMAWREIGKIIGAYAPDQKELILRLEDATAARLQQMTTAELLKAAEGGKLLVDRENDPLEAEYTVLLDALEEPVPIDYSQDDVTDDGSDATGTSEPED